MMSPSSTAPTLRRLWAGPIIWRFTSSSARACRQVRLDRSNTVIKVAGNLAWACYQWDFAATVDGQPSTAQGQTTLVHGEEKQSLDHRAQSHFDGADDDHGHYSAGHTANRQTLAASAPGGSG